jgi:DNA-binding transcriptional regulator YdaS (Cro superfamily)
MKEDKSLAVTLRIEKIIITVRGQRVILDSDLAALYGVSTKALNQAVKR